MNIVYAKTIPLDAFLERIGYRPAKTIRGELWYQSPFRTEKTPSFKLSRDRLAWFDHGDGVGGNILDLAYHLQSGQAQSGRLDGSQVADALNFIEQAVGSVHTIPPIRLCPAPAVFPGATPAYTLMAARPMADHRGETWCRSRGLAVAGVGPYLHDVYFNRSEKPKAKDYYGIGLPNTSGGYEVRSQLDGGPWIKTVVGAKDISVFPAERPEAPWLTFEGMPDFGTFLTIDQPPVGAYHYLILNGTGMTRRAIEYLTECTPSTLIICSQQGEPAQVSRLALERFAADQGWYGGNIDHKWLGSKDYNEHLVKKKGLFQANIPVGRVVGLKPRPELDV